jgi:hypothetical protein
MYETYVHRLSAALAAVRNIGDLRVVPVLCDETLPSPRISGGKHHGIQLQKYSLLY